MNHFMEPSSEKSPMQPRNFVTRFLSRFWNKPSPQDLPPLSTKGFATLLVTNAPWIVEHINSTPHFGILQELATSEYSRRDYVARHIDILLKMKEKHPGLGLGSAGAAGQSIKHGGKELSGLELAQTWALIFNSGHLFGTFATERALQFTLYRRNPRYKDLIKDIDSKLHPICRRLLKNESMYDFSKVLAAWRLSTEKIPNDIRETSLKAFAAYFQENDDRLARIIRLYRKTRQLAYLTIHDIADLGVSFDDATIDGALEHLIEDDGIRFEPFDRREVHLSRLFNAIDRYQYDTFFTGKQAASEVLTHLGDFKHWWQKQEQDGLGVRERIRQLMGRPADWPRRQLASDLIAIADLEIPLMGKRWIDEATQWWEQGSPWDKDRANFFITYGPEDNYAKINIVAEADIGQQTLYHIGVQLVRHCRNSWKKTGMEFDVKVRLWRTIARYSQLLFGRILKDDLHFLLRPIKAEPGHQGYAALAVDTESLAERMSLFADKCDKRSMQRASELKMAVKYLRKLGKQEGLWLAILASSSISDGNREVNEIDGVIARIERDSVEWHLLEVKESGTRGARSQLSRLQQGLRHSSSVIEKVDVDGKIITILKVQASS